MKKRIVCFAGHRYAWQNIGVEEKLKKAIVEIIEKGYTTFYDGGKGYFDKISADIVISLKKTYPNIKIYKILTYYHHEKKWNLPSCYDGSIYPDLEKIHPKAKIIKRNKWIVENSDILICHICETYKSGAFNTVKYARKINKPVIYV